MSLHTYTSNAHLHAVARHEEFLAEADKDRLVAAVRTGATGGGRVRGVMVRRQLGTALIRAGELLRGRADLTPEAA